MNKREKVLNIVATLLPFVCIVIMWAIFSRAINNQVVLPSFSNTIKEFFKLFTYAEFYKSFAFTFLRSLIAFSISFLLSLLVAILSKKYKFFKRAISPLLVVITTLPTIAVVLLLLVWTNSQVAPVIVTILVVFPTLTVNVSSALSVVDPKTIEMARFYKISEKEIYKKIIFPQIKPELISAAGSSLALNLKLMVAAEVLSYTINSIGNYLSLSKLYDQTAKMMALVLVVVLTGLVINFITAKISKRWLKWKE
ncbi:MAG: ABC transporter permease subunit [Clostridia bacterium]|nr:ABC transporter permease subunit [Clostridia bacterium]